jgi:hypothetical protein
VQLLGLFRTTGAVAWRELRALHVSSAGHAAAPDASHAVLVTNPCIRAFGGLEGINWEPACKHALLACMARLSAVRSIRHAMRGCKHYKRYKQALTSLSNQLSLWPLLLASSTAPRKFTMQLLTIWTSINVDCTLAGTCSKWSGLAGRDGKLINKAPDVEASVKNRVERHGWILQ